MASGTTSRYTFWDDPETTSWFTVRLDYNTSRSGSNVTTTVTPHIHVAGTGGAWYNNRILVDIAIGGTYTGEQTVKGATTGTVVNANYPGASRSRTYVNNSTSVPIVIKLRDHAGRYFGTKTISLTLAAPAAIPAAPSVSLSSITRSSVVLSWSSSLSASSISYQLNGGTWVYPGGSGTSGAFTISGLGNGTYYSINVQVQGPGGWSPNRNATMTTLHVSTMSGIAAGAAWATNDTLYLSFARTQTGGSTSIRYRVSGGSWSAYTTGTTGAISGLANNTSYTVQFEALNSSGQVNSYSTTGRTHAMPTGSFTLAEANKKNVVVVIGAVANATVRRLSLNNGAWQDTPENRTFPVSPGQTYNVRLQLYSSSTGLTFTSGYQNISMPALAAISSFSVIARSRTSATIRMAFSDNVNQITLSVGTTSNEVQNITSGKTFDLPITKSGLVSGTNYTLTVKVRDTNNGDYNSNQTYTFSTDAFIRPEVVLTPRLTSVTAVYTIKDSCRMEGSSTLYSSGQKVTVKFLKASNGANLVAGTNYTLTTNFIDEHRPGNTAVEASATTSTIPTISSYSSSPNTISSLTGAFPQLGLNLSDTRYSKRVVYSVAGKAVSKTIALGTAQDTTLLTKTQVDDILRATTTATRSPISVTVYFTDDGIESPSTRTSTLDITLAGSVLTVNTPTSGGIVYSAAGGLTLTALVSSSINQVEFTIPAQPVPLGATIIKEQVLFQGKIYAVPTGRKVIVSGVSTFNVGRVFQVQIEDSRGLVNRKEFAVSTYEYSNPVLQVAGIERSNGGFGEDLEITNLGATWSSPPTTTGKNYLNGILLRVTNRAGVIADYGTIIPRSSLETTGTGQINKNFPMTNILSKTLSNIGRVFLTNNTYRLTLVARDAFGREAVILNYSISTGEPAMFVDTANRVVGFSTVAPRGAAEVNGDFFATKQFSLNGLIFSPEDLVDL